MAETQPAGKEVPMVRQERIRRRIDADADRPDGDGGLDRLPRRPAADTRTAAALIERIRRLLVDSRTGR
jgi:hypothetical protein